MDQKTRMHDYLRRRRADLVRRLDGLSEYDAHRPLTPTGTSIIGLVKHTASVQLGYFGEVFGRPAERVLPWEADGAAPDDDMWATRDESIADIVDFHHYSAAHSDQTIDALTIDAEGSVPWWPEERRTVTLGWILTHVVSETAQHAGHADILRELLDGVAGTGPGDPNLPERTVVEWAAYRAKIEAEAVAAGRRG